MTDDEGHECSTCPRCEMRRKLVALMYDEEIDFTMPMLDQLLDAVEAIRAIDWDDDDNLFERQEAAANLIAIWESVGMAAIGNGCDT